ncbi:MAG: hypothetical protein ABW138_05940, partial [Candidatus Thiodiazotropha sp. 4PDIVS1]
RVKKHSVNKPLSRPKDWLTGKAVGCGLPHRNSTPWCQGIEARVKNRDNPVDNSCSVYHGAAGRTLQDEWDPRLSSRCISFPRSAWECI